MYFKLIPLLLNLSILPSALSYPQESEPCSTYTTPTTTPDAASTSSTTTTSSPTQSYGLGTLTSWDPDRPWLDSLKVENGGLSFVLGATGAGIYCPTGVNPCPDSGELVVYWPNWGLNVEVPGGQQTFISFSGLLTYTQAHSIYMPNGPALADTGIWTFHSLAIPSGDLCPGNSPHYNCAPALGYWSFVLPNGTDTGVLACPLSGCSVDGPLYTLYVQEPLFNVTGCTRLKGVKVHSWEGENPAAWQYY
ncbi:MAG: hypothetical protein M1834_000348 [Cirrosporium novae-zelandiae]|nr:MAG: hypothetical protein M1834_000348 [Cirrosporium novae-zelandiae]